MTTSSPSSTTSWPDPRRRGLLDGTLVVFALSRFSLLRGKRAWGLVVLCFLPLIPPLVSMLWGERQVQGPEGLLSTVEWGYFKLCNRIVCLFLACATLGEEIEGKTMPYLLTRAIPRSAVLLGRYLSYLTAAVVLLSFFLGVTYLLLLGPMGTEALGEALPTLMALLLGVFLSSAAYGALFVLLSLVVKKPLMVGLVFLFFFELWASGAAEPIRKLTVLHPVAVSMCYLAPEPQLLALAQAHSLADLDMSRGQALQSLAILTVVPLALAAFVFRRKEYTF